MKLQTLNFEFGISFPVVSREKLERHLQHIWHQHLKQKGLLLEDDLIPIRQGFLSFDGHMARARNYVGFIQVEDDYIEIYPKVFKGQDISKDEMLRHLFYWFDYCRKWRFPFSNVQLDSLDNIDLPELIINLIANKIFEVISTSPISLYEDVEEALLMPRGSINFSRYIQNSLSNGNFHVLECDYEPLLYDNRLNKVIKYVSRILIGKSKVLETRRKLDDILFILDDVEDCFCNSSMLSRININSFFSDYHTVLSLCKLVLDQQLYNNQYSEQDHWSLLLPMEYIFEDFIAGFLERHFSVEWEVHYQKSDLYLTDEGVFQMQHDIFLTAKEDSSVKIIIDTKYKVRNDLMIDQKKGVSQADLYQMTSYAYRRGCNNVLLLYPNQTEVCSDIDSFTISSFDKHQQIKVYAADVPFWSIQGSKNVTKLLRVRIEELLNAFKIK